MSSYGPSQLNGYDFTRIKLFCDPLYLQTPQNALNQSLLTFHAPSGNWLPGGIAAFGAYQHGPGQSVTTTAQALTYDTQTYSNAGVFQHTVAQSGVTVLLPGVYLISAGSGLQVTSGSTNSHTRLWLSKNNIEIPGTVTYAYTFQNGTYAQGNLQCVQPLTSGDVLRCHAQLSASGNIVTTLPDSVRLSIILLAAGGVQNSLSGCAMGGGLFSFITYP